MSDERRQVCDVCKRSRKCKRVGSTYEFRCGECMDLPSVALAEARDLGKERVKQRTEAAKKAYPCIGGPLDGMFAMVSDFHRAYGTPDSRWYSEGGMYAHLANEYLEYNASSRHNRGSSSMIYVHTSLIKQPVRGRDR